MGERTKTHNYIILIHTLLESVLSVFVWLSQLYIISYSSFPVTEDQSNVLVLCVTGYQVPPESPLRAAAVAAVKAPRT